MSMKAKLDHTVNLIGVNAAPRTWVDFASLAEEWFVIYAYSHKWLTSPTIFALAHSIELYLKACLAKREGNVEAAVDFGHRIHDLWQDLKSKDCTFLPDYEIRKHILDDAFEMEDDVLQGRLTQAN